jgi:hypothetical protein
MPTVHKLSERHHFCCNLIHLVFALAATTFVFYADEGYNNFKWMFSIGNWVTFAIYSTFFILIQKAVQWSVMKQFNGYLQAFLSALMGSFFLMLALFILFGR